MSDNFAPEGHRAPGRDGAPEGHRAPGGDGALGHFTNETDRHTDHINNGHCTQGLFLYDQQHPYNGPERQTVAVQVNTVFGQARLVELDRGNFDADAEGDGSESIQYINAQQPASSSDQQQQNSHLVVPIASLEVPVPAVQDNQSSQPPLGMTGVQVQNPSLPEGTQDDFNLHAQSLSGFSTLGMNHIAQQIQELPPDGNSSVQQLLNRQQGATGNDPQQVSDTTVSAGIAYPPIQQNRPQQNVRAECTVDFAPNGGREEARLPGCVSSITSKGDSQNRTISSSSSGYRTAEGAGASEGGGDVDRHNTNMNRLKAADRCRIRHPKFSSLEARFLSFFNIRVKLTQTPQSLTEAGLFFTGYKDTCRCYYCGGDLHSWTPEDDPWQEHARFYPNCGHVKQEKGQEYIDSIQLVVRLSQGKTDVKEIGASKTDFPGKGAIIRSIEEMGVDRDKILIAWELYQGKVNAGKIPRVSDPTNEILDIVQDLPDLKSPASQGPRPNSSKGNKVNAFDFTLCPACKTGKAVVSQKECGHVVCTGCAPSRSVCKCRLCGKEVVDAYLVDLC